MLRTHPKLYVLLGILCGACGSGNTEPLDGGRPLDLERDPASIAIMVDDPCWRREKGGWHNSVGHCEAMTQPARMTGVFVTAFEERSFFPGESEIPRPDDWRRFTVEIELNSADVEKRTGVTPSNGDGDAYMLSFVGRRTRDPYLVDCQGMPHHVVVVDQLTRARYLGPMAKWEKNIEDLKSRPVLVTRKHKGRWGEEERAAIERCK